MEDKEKLEKIRERITKPMLSVSRVPPKTLKRFLEMCSYDEFADDRGMLLKYLIDFHDGIIPKGTEEIEIQIDVLGQKIVEIEQRLENIEKKEEQPKKRLGVKNKNE